MTTTPVKTCFGCPSYMKPNEAAIALGKSVGAAVCARYGHILSKPGSKSTQDEQLAKHRAASCPSYGMPAPGSVPAEARAMPVTLPDPAARAEQPPIEKEACTSCAMCRNFIRDDIVATELGWTAGLCAARGRLILPNRHAYEARDCDFRGFGVQRTTTSGLTLLPELEDAFMVVDPIKSYFKNKEHFVDPSEYETDREVTDEEQASGIRAWRRIVDPNGTGNEVFLPIYRLDFFDEKEQALIPRTGDDEHPELYVDHFGGVYMAAVCWMELDETPALWGQPGTGKTELYRHLSWLMCVPFRRISITASTELDDIMGKMHYSPDKGTYFVYGRLPDAWRKPGVICLDEPNVGRPEVWQAIRPLTDNSKQLVLDMNENEYIARHDDCYLGMAMNPAWDVKNIGAEPIGDADVNRLFHIFIDIPPRELEEEIIKNRVKLDGWELSASQLEMMMEIAKEVRGLIDDGTLPITWAIRPQIKVARALRWFEPITAYRRAVTDYLEPEVAEHLLNAVKAHVQ